jgi:Cu/Ag efflux protein CusF
MLVIAVSLLGIAAVAVAATSASAGEGATATGTVNSIDVGAHKINITHDPVPALDWPGMTMDFRLAEGAELTGVEPGARVRFEISRGSGAMYQVDSVTVLEE